MNLESWNEKNKAHDKRPLHQNCGYCYFAGKIDTFWQSFRW